MPEDRAGEVALDKPHTSTLAEVVKVGYWYDPPNLWSNVVPVLHGWHIKGGDFAGLDLRSGGLGGWSKRALREMAATFGTAVLNERLPVALMRTNTK